MDADRSDDQAPERPTPPVLPCPAPVARRAPVSAIPRHLLAAVLAGSLAVLVACSGSDDGSAVPAATTPAQAVEPDAATTGPAGLEGIAAPGVARQRWQQAGIADYDAEVRWRYEVPDDVVELLDEEPSWEATAVVEVRGGEVVSGEVTSVTGTSPLVPGDVTIDALLALADQPPSAGTSGWLCRVDDRGVVRSCAEIAQHRTAVSQYVDVLSFTER